MCDNLYAPIQTAFALTISNSRDLSRITSWKDSCLAWPFRTKDSGVDKQAKATLGDALAWFKGRRQTGGIVKKVVHRINPDQSCTFIKNPAIG
ncbi:MAG: hypothetical protein CMM01_12315 [Rhodopirellula sp.]|nr:hypothetical protein [Rhodopirellula sp.]OUX50995.1 MAG: hypothetical protein CBE43_05055 [Rhodopirellula sp. TMED283]